jgi:hypothetical protein
MQNVAGASLSSPTDEMFQRMRNDFQPIRWNISSVGAKAIKGMTPEAKSSQSLPCVGCCLYTSITGPLPFLGPESGGRRR